MSALADFADYLGGPRAALPDAVAAKTRLHIADGVAAWAAATGTREGRRLLSLNDAMCGDTGDSRLATLQAVATHCGLARLSEIDDIHLSAGVTPGGVVIPAALVLADRIGETDDTAIIAAIIAGYDAACRLGLVLGGPKALYRGVWPTYFAAPFGTAAVAANLLRLDAAQTRNALAIAVSRAAANVGGHGDATTARWYALGRAAQEGVAAAFAAENGLTGDDHLIGPDYLQKVFGLEPDPSALTLGLGTDFALLATSMKPWCAARQTIAPVQALREMVSDGLGPSGIASIVAHVPPPTAKMIDHGVRSGDRASFLTSLPYQLATAAHAPQNLFDVQQCPDDVRNDVAALMTKISVEPDEDLVGPYPSAWPARLVITTSSETTVEHAVTHVPGDPQRAFTAQDLGAKIASVLGNSPMRNSLSFCNGLLANGHPSPTLAEGFVSLRADLANAPR